ncbi:clavesin-1 [Ischnura elegans]|uniref:clavesin-1 n=1 Tax=Ischnura elegans TaxID=197161 RepID=UPI001ED8844A|nr:clavesin-1 [Ischnura elegans]
MGLENGNDSGSLNTDFFGKEAEAAYEWRLSEDFRSVAQTELREDDATREAALTQLRTWIHSHPLIKSCRTDSVFLLRFLRTKKFSIPQTQEILERYLTIRQAYPTWFRGLSVDDKVVNDILDSGYLVPLPQRDKNGYKVILSSPGRLDSYKYSATDVIRTHSVVVEVLMDEEESQIKGFVYINDESGLQMSHLSMWSFSELRRITKCIQNSTPMRHKETHFINIPSFANKLIEFVISILSEKLKKRVKFHNTIDDLKEHIDPKILPREYGGITPISDMIADFKRVMVKHRESIQALEDMNITLAKDSKGVVAALGDLADDEDLDVITGISGSFRKLEVD